MLISRNFAYETILRILTKNLFCKILGFSKVISEHDSLTGISGNVLFADFPFSELSTDRRSSNKAIEVAETNSAKPANNSNESQYMTIKNK
ncbi:hypothetical protein C2G38_2175626 [Gigaspora rosea]|uniref:Uncharacterized protein n=1 Tax=Gigaspora rosea TaxID=44941 RepID=A0A397VKE6_9GLOM|nr:hypothetical protein C2G38_2175626 [Gigaspora rosea]